MAIQVKGLFKVPSLNGLMCESPQIVLTPYLQFKGGIHLEVQVGTYAIVRYDVDKSTLHYNKEITDPYTQLIDALEAFTIEQLKSYDELNAQATYEHI